VQEDAKVLVFAAFLEAALNFVAHLAALSFVGRVDVEKPRFATEGFDLVLNTLHVTERRAPVEVNADDVASRAGQKAADCFAEAARSSKDESPTR
jgi:hypothetical protein